MSDDCQPEEQEAPPYDGPPFQEVTSQEDMGIFTQAEDEPPGSGILFFEPPPLEWSGAEFPERWVGIDLSAEADQAAVRVVPTRPEDQPVADAMTALMARVMRDRAARPSFFERFLASGKTWTEDEIAAVMKPKRPRATVELPVEAMYCTNEHRQQVAQRLRETAQLVEAGYNLHRAEHDDYSRAFVLHFELSGEPVTSYPTDNSPALGGQKET